MTKHPNKVVGFSGTLEELAKQVGNMTYNQTSTLLELLANDFTRQAARDSLKGRKQLSSKLYDAADKLYKAQEDLDKAWNICKPYMK